MQDSLKLISGIEKLYLKKERLEDSLITESNGEYLNPQFINEFLSKLQIINDALEYLQQMKKQADIQNAIREENYQTEIIHGVL